MAGRFKELLLLLVVACGGRILLKSAVDSQSNRDKSEPVATLAHSAARDSLQGMRKDSSNGPQEDSMDSRGGDSQPSVSIEVRPTNAKLVDAMTQFRKDVGRDTYRSFLEQFVRSIVLVPTPDPPPEGKPRIQSASPEVELRVFTGRTMDGTKKVLCVFTDEEEYLRAKPPCNFYYEMQATVLIEFAQRQGVDQVVINTASAHAVAVDSSHFTLLAAGKVPDLQ